MPREYKMRKRADDWQKTRERILQATMQLHDEQGVAPTTFSDIAKRAGLGQATLYRHFPTLGDLVRTCGGHVWLEMQPPTAEGAAAAVEAGVEAYVKEALAPAKPPRHTIDVVAALMSFPVWQRLGRLELSPRKSRELTLRMIQCAMRAAESL